MRTCLFRLWLNPLKELSLLKPGAVQCNDVFFEAEEVVPVMWNRLVFDAHFWLWPNVKVTGLLGCRRSREI